MNINKAVRTTYFNIAGNAGLAVIKLAAGYLGNSYALVADGIESTSDIFSSVLVLFGLKYANRPADRNHPYGHGRIEPLVTFIVVGFLITSALIIARESIININTPHDVPKAWTLIVLGTIIGMKEFFYRITIRKSEETGSTSLRADAWHHRSDAITSVAAFIGVTIALIGGKGYETADDWAALFASGFILYNSYLIFRPALGELLDEHYYDDLTAKIRATSLTVDGILDTEKCLIRKTGTRYHVDLHAVVDGTLTVREGHEIAHALKSTLMNELPELSDVLIHIEPDTI